MSRGARKARAVAMVAAMRGAAEAKRQKPKRLLVVKSAAKAIPTQPQADQEAVEALPPAPPEPQPVQFYRYLRHRTYVSPTGRRREVIDWQTDCPDCGLPFEIFTNTEFKAPFRRCLACSDSRRTPTGIKAVPLWPEGAGERPPPNHPPQEHVGHCPTVPGSVRNSDALANSD